MDSPVSIRSDTQMLWVEDIFSSLLFWAQGSWMKLQVSCSTVLIRRVFIFNGAVCEETSVGPFRATGFLWLSFIVRSSDSNLSRGAPLFSVRRGQVYSIYMWHWDTRWKHPSSDMSTNTHNGPNSCVSPESDSNKPMQPTTVASED